MANTHTNKNCAGCTKPLPKYEYLQCTSCNAAYDLECLNMTSKRYNSFYARNNERKSSWKCPECHSKQPKVGNLNTPVRPTTAAASQPESPSDEVVDPLETAAQSDLNVTHRARTNKKNDFLHEQISPSGGLNNIESTNNDFNQLVLAELRAIRLAMTGLTTAIQAQNSRLDCMEERMNSYENSLSEKETKKGEIIELEQTITQLKMEIQEREQDMLLNDIEISNLTETNGENATHILLTVAQKLGVQLEERDVVMVERAGPVRAYEEGAAPPRPRPLVARLARRALRDSLLTAARVRRGLTTEGLPRSGAVRPVYVNERLTRSNRQLFQEARAAAKSQNWKYVWTKGGKIFTRREHGTAGHRIRSHSDINKVFGI